MRQISADELVVIMDVLEAERDKLHAENDRLRADMKLSQEFSRAEIQKRDAQLQTQYDIVDRQNSEIKRLGGFVAEMQPELGKLKTENEQLRAQITEIEAVLDRYKPLESWSP